MTLQQFIWIVKDAPSYAEIIYRDFDGNPYIPEVEYDKDKIVINIRPQKNESFRVGLEDCRKSGRSIVWT